MSLLSYKSTPGFQGSERSGCEATIYRQGTTRGQCAYPLDGRTAQDERPCIVSVQVNKNMGAAGSFTLQLKTPYADPDLIANVLDDDWIDIFLLRGNTRYHVLRGLIDEVRRDDLVGGSGATTTMFTLVGRDFQKIYEQTPIWFNRFTGENVCGAAAYQLVSAPNIGGSVADTVALFLQGFLQQAGDKGRANFTMPDGMPDVQQDFASTVNYDPSNYSNIPARRSISQTLMDPQGFAWDLAKEWSDPMFCELFTEMYTLDGTTGEDGTDPSTTVMRTVLRDKPFPMVDPSIAADGLPTGLASQWFQLPMFTIPRQALVGVNVGCSGYERYNAFFVCPQLVHDLLKSDLQQLDQPLWDTTDMLKHGMRRFDIVSRYTTESSDLLTMSKTMRCMARDWYCMNPYWLQGSLTFGSGRPELRLGCRLRIPGTRSPTEDETYYIEGYAHTWNVVQGMRSTAVVTRGWRGTDAELVQTLTSVSGSYSVAQPATGG